MSGENASDQAAAAAAAKGSSSTEGGEQVQSAEANAAAANARRESQAEVIALKEEMAQLRAEVNNGNNQRETSEVDHSFDYDTVSDPTKLQAEVDRRAAESATSEVQKLREELAQERAQSEAQKTAASIRTGFEIFNDSEYGQDAQDMLNGRLSRVDGEITEEVYKEACAEVAKRISKTKAANGNADADKQTGSTTPPPNGSGAAMAVNTNQFSDPKMTARERKAKINEQLTSKYK